MIRLTIYHTIYHPIYQWSSDVIFRIFRISKKCANKQKNTNTVFHFLLYCMVNVVNRVNSVGGYWKMGGKWVENAQTNGKTRFFDVSDL